VDLTLIAEELGARSRRCLSSRTVVATRLLAAAGTDAELIQAAVAGDGVAVALQPLRPGEAQLVPDAAVPRGT